MSWFDRLLRQNQSSSNVAKDRLKMVLTHDRAAIPPGMVAVLKDDIIDVITKRISVDPDSVIITIDRSGPESMLIAEIPINPPPKSRRKVH